MVTRFGPKPIFCVKCMHKRIKRLAVFVNYETYEYLCKNHYERTLFKPATSYAMVNI